MTSTVRLAAAAAGAAGSAWGDAVAGVASGWLAGPQAPQGLDLLGRVLDKHPEHAGAHAALAEYYERIGQPGRAAEHRRRAAGER